MSKPLHNTVAITINIEMLLFYLRTYIDQINTSAFKDTLIPYNFGHQFKQLEDLIINYQINRILGKRIGLNIEKEDLLLSKLSDEFKAFYLEYLSKLNSYMTFESDKYLYEKILDMDLENLFSEDYLFVKTTIIDNELHILITRENIPNV